MRNRRNSLMHIHTNHFSLTTFVNSPTESVGLWMVPKILESLISPKWPVADAWNFRSSSKIIWEQFQCNFRKKCLVDRKVWEIAESFFCKSLAQLFLGLRLVLSIHKLYINYSEIWKSSCKYSIKLRKISKSRKFQKSP